MGVVAPGEEEEEANICAGRHKNRYLSFIDPFFFDSYVLY